MSRYQPYAPPLSVPRVLHRRGSMWGIARCTYRAAKQAVYSARIAYWAVIVWNIDETLRACAEDGLIESLSISEWNAQRDDASARIILLRAGVWA